MKSRKKFPFVLSLSNYEHSAGRTKPRICYAPGARCRFLSLCSLWTYALGSELPLNSAGVCPGFLLHRPALLQVLCGKGRHAESLILFHMRELMRP